MRTTIRRSTTALFSTAMVLSGPLALTGATAPASAGTEVRYTTSQIALSEDAYVMAESPTTNYGTKLRLNARSTPDNHKVAYLKITVPSDTVGSGRISAATLRLTPSAVGAGTVQVRPVASTSWTEAGLTHSNAPVTSAPVASLTVTDTAVRTVDLTSSMPGSGTYAFAITADAGAYGNFWSSEAATGGPTLSLTVAHTVCTPDFPGDPLCTDRMYYGASVQGGDPAKLEALTGRKLGVFRSFMHAGTPPSALVDRARSDLANGRIPLISTKVPGDDWAGVAAGRHDDWLLQRIRALAALDGPVWLVLHHEPSSDGTPAHWVAMQQHARKLIDANAKNIALVGILNGWEFKRAGATPEVWRMPVGTGVHVMGFDSYNPWSPTNGKDWRSASHVLSPAVTIRSWGYRSLVGEHGVRTDPANPGKAAQWLKDAYAFGLANDLVAMSYFHSGANSPDGTWELDGERLKAYTENLGRPETARL